MRSLTTADLERALGTLLPPLDPETVEFKDILVDLAEHLGVDVQELRSKHKAELKEIIPTMVHLCTGGANKENEDDDENEEEEEEEDDDDEDEDPAITRKPVKRPRTKRIEEFEDESTQGSGDSDEDDEVKPKRRKKAVHATKVKKASAKRQTSTSRKPAEKIKESDGMAALKELCRVAGLLNPSLYATLKKLSSDEDREEALRERLREGGVRFTSPYPTKGEISAAKRKREKVRELDGIDSSLIVTGGRSRRSATQPASYVTESIIGDDDDEEADRIEQEQPDENEEESEANDGSEASDDSEAEF